MIGIAWKLLTSKLAGPIGAGVSVLLLLALLASCTQLKAKDSAIKSLAKNVAKLSMDLGTCQGNRAKLEAGIASQNAAVDALAAEGKRRAAEARKALDAAQARVAAANKRVGQLLTVKPGADRCASAEALIIGGLE